MILAWGDCDGPCLADLNADGFVDVADLTVLFLNWESCSLAFDADVG